MNLIYLKQTIEKAILEKRWLRIDFVSVKMKITKDRVIEPYRVKISKRDNAPAVEAWCYLRNDYREFPLEGIQKIEVISPADYNKSDGKRTLRTTDKDKNPGNQKRS